MYLADYHVHSSWSADTRASMPEMAAAALEQGLQEICFTDHVDIMSSGKSIRNVYDWQALEAAYAAVQEAFGEQLQISRGVELGEAPRDFAYAETLLEQMPEMDFVIGSRHQLSDAYGNLDLYVASAHDPVTARNQIRDYLEHVYQLACWARFSVLGHLTLPLRYMNENNGLHMTFDEFEGDVVEILRLLIEKGCGIEVNTNRGNPPLPDAKWLRVYRALGGEIVTIGSDAHNPSQVGCHIRECQQLLRDCGFTKFCTFQKLQPIWHEL